MDVLFKRFRTQQAPNVWSILTLWREGFDTFDIGEMLGVEEHEIANRLIHHREQSGVGHGS